MADTQISELTFLPTPVDTDELMISDAGVSKKITMANLGVPFIMVTKTANTDVMCSTTLVDVEDMQFTPNINKNYQVFMQIRVTGGGGNMITGFIAPTNATTRSMQGNIRIDSSGTELLDGSTQITTLIACSNLNLNYFTSVHMGACAGDIKLQMAQQFSNAATSSILPSSTMMVYQVD